MQRVTICDLSSYSHKSDPLESGRLSCVACFMATIQASIKDIVITNGSTLGNQYYTFCVRFSRNNYR